jgi:hypothetical protein
MVIRGYSQRSPSSLAHSIRFHYVFAMLVLIDKPSATVWSIACG